MSSLRPALLLAAFLTACGPVDIPPIVVPDAGRADAGELIPTTNAEHNQMLEVLGFDTSLGKRLDPAGVAVVETWHPLGKRFASFHPRSELYVGGFTVGSVREHLYDDASRGYAAIPFTGKEDTSWAGATMKNGVAGDFDGDGLDELFIAYYVDATDKLRFIVLDIAGNGVKEGELDPAVPSTNLDTLLQPSLAAGDLDGDGREEVAVGFGRFYFVDELEKATAVVKVKSHDGQDQNDAFVAMGNLDWDGADELVVTYTRTSGGTIGRYAIYDGNFVTPVQEGNLQFTDHNNVSHTARDANVTIGDVDGDRLGEVVFGALVDGNYWGLFILEGNRPTDTPLYGWRSFFYRPGWVNAAIPRPLFTLDWNGDSVREVFWNGALYKVGREPTPTVLDVGINVTLRRAAAGDVDGDGRDELLYEWGPIIARGLNSLDVPENKKTWTGNPTAGTAIILAPANIDRDSAVVRYDGEHELLFTAPQLVAVLASPPYRNGIGQNLDATTSTFGKSHGETTEKEESLGFSVGFSVGYEADVGFFGGAKFTAELEYAMDFISSQSTTVEKYHSYTTGPGEDKVVFTTVPFDVYYYTVVSSPDDADVGRRMSINLPREPQTMSSTVGFYNAHNGGGLDVNGNILRHVLGNVESYPTLSERNQLLAAAVAREPGYKKLWNGPMTVGEGTGFETIGISQSKGEGNSTQMDFNAKFSFESKSFGGFTVGASVGFHYGYTSSFSTEDTAFFEGSVGNIPAASYADNRYSFGLFVYPGEAGGQKFLVMNYWTER